MTPRQTYRLPLKALSLAIAMAALAPTAMAADATSRTYHLAAGPLADVLARFAASAGVPLSFDPALLKGAQSQGLDGNYSVPEGFARLLAGSGYSLITTDSGGYTLAPTVDLGNALELGATTINSDLAASSDTWQGGQVARSARLGVLGDQAISDVPFSVTSYTAKTIADQQARTVGDV
ncbi:MAG: secretin and TonB N-terminal domain-containing protein, partial [Pseudomonas putida]